MNLPESRHQEAGSGWKTDFPGAGSGAGADFEGGGSKIYYLVRGRFTAHMVSAVIDVKGTYLPPPRLVRGFLI